MSTPDDRHETPDERDDRNLMELLQELRVAGLGVQVLFGFLLSLPFTNGFAKLSHAQRGLYMADLILAALATILLVGPVAYHRLVFRHHLKNPLVNVANRSAIAEKSPSSAMHDWHPARWASKSSRSFWSSKPSE